MLPDSEEKDEFLYQNQLFSYLSGQNVQVNKRIEAEPKADSNTVGYDVKHMDDPVYGYFNMKDKDGALPISSLMYRHKLPVGAQFRSYEVPVCAAMALVLLLPPLCRHKLKRGQGWMCLALYFAYLAAALLLPRAGA